MGVTDDLRARGNINGFYIRPSTGKRVSWVLCQPVQDLLEQGKRLKWQNLGTIGNQSHLAGVGDHTGHSAGKVPGVVYAKDTALPSGGTAALLWLCGQADYDTTWIDFFNVGGSQYNYAGKRVRSSADQHLHVSVRRGKELLRAPLFDDVQAVIRGTFGKPVPEPFKRLGFIDGATLVKRDASPAVWLAGRGKRTLILDARELSAVESYLRDRGAQWRIVPVETLSGEEV